MHEKVLELIVFILSELKDDKRLSDIDISSLTQQGFTHAEINSAYNWVFDHFMPGASVPGPFRTVKPYSHRILHSAERLAIAPEAYGYLLQIRELGIVTDEEQEFIIERIMMTGISGVTTDDIMSLIAAVLFESDDRSKQPPRLFSNGSETIH